MAVRNYQNHQNQNQNQPQQQIKEIKKPFIGPRPFSQDPEDQKLFFGRNYESEKIISLIYSHKLVLVYAQSGAGKTSLFNAQIVPELEKKGLQVLPIARVGIGSDLTDKATTINPEKSNDNDVTDSKEINLYLLNTFQSLVPTISDHSILKNQNLSTFLKVHFPHQRNQRGKDIPQVLVFDQLEEIFNLFSDPNKWQEHQKDFFSNIADALDNDPLLRIVFVIREDYLAQLDPFVSILPENLKPRFRLERLRKDDAIQAIKGPLERLNYDVPVDEIEQIVQDLMKIKVETITGKSLEVIGDFIEPIHLQVVCQRWWYERFISKDTTTKSKSNLLPLDLTNVDKALEDFYLKSINEAVRKNRVKEEDLRKWCEENLITSSGTRSNIHLEANVTKGIPNKAIEILAEQYLIRREWRAGAYWYELTHDRLIGPIKESNKKWNEKKQKSKRAFRIKVFVPIILISIISISLAVLAIQEGFEQERQEIKQDRQTITQQQEDINQLTRGINLYGQGRYEEASAVFDKVLSINPNYTEALYYKGLTLEELSKSDKDLSKLDQALQYYDKALEIDPTHSSALFQKAYVLDNQKKYAEAIDYWDKTLAIDPTDVHVLNNKGSAFHSLDKYDEAITWYDKALAIDPTYVTALYNKGTIYNDLDNYEEAINWFDKALAIDPNDIDAVVGKGDAFRNLDNYEEAINWYDKALAIDPTYVDALDGKGDVYYDQQNYSKAIEYYDIALAIDPNNTNILNGKGNVYYDQQQYDEALQYYDNALAVDKNDSIVLYNKGITFFAQQQYDEAITWYDKALAIDPTYVDALLGKGDVYYDQQNYSKAIEYYDKALAIDPNNTNTLNGKGDVYYDQQQYDESLQYYNRTLEIDPNNTYAVYSKGYIFSDQEKYDEALQEFDKALEIDPTYVDALLGKGDVYYDQQNYSKAIEYYDKALAIDPNYHYTLNAKAFALANLDRNAEALPLIQKALESDSKNEFYLSTAALITYNLGKYDDAKSYFEEALQINHNLKDILEGKEITAFNELMNNNTK
jgi:tetratricopeptide (TPR) repeat protein